MTTELTKRVQTGVAGAAILLLVIFFGGWIGIYLLTAALALAMVYEFTAIAFTLPDNLEKRYLLLSLSWFGTLASVLVGAEFEVLLGIFFALFGYFLWSAGRYRDEELSSHFRELMASVFAMVYLVFLPMYLPKIHGSPNGIKWTLLFLFIVWANDTGAYFVGKKWGRRKLYPRISPKKTVEGSLGGLGSGFVVTLLFKFLVLPGLAWAGVVLIPLLVGTFSQFGDLAESFLKRAFGTKDSGKLLPGHGGVLDRFDGVVFALPLMYACIRIFI